MVPESLPDPAQSINISVPSLPTHTDLALKRLNYHDQLHESLAKAEAMLFVFSCAQRDNFSEHVMQNFLQAVLDMVCQAADALKALEEMKDNTVSLT